MGLQQESKSGGVFFPIFGVGPLGVSELAEFARLALRFLEKRHLFLQLLIQHTYCCFAVGACSSPTACRKILLLNSGLFLFLLQLRDICLQRPLLHPILLLLQ